MDIRTLGALVLIGACLGLEAPAALAQDRAGAAVGTPTTQGGAARPAGGFFKVPALPAGAFSAGSTLAGSPLRREWVDIPYGRQRLHTWIEYPAGEAPAGVVLVMSHEAGLDDWMRALADQLALDGFIAVAPDILSGLGPGGGDFDSFPFQTDVIGAMERLPQAEALRRYAAALDYALKLPRANGRSASLGVGMGGADSFKFAAETSKLNAAVVFYGVSPGERDLARIAVPVAGFYGEDDARVMPTVRSAEAFMRERGKPYEAHVYRGATQAFLRSSVEGENSAAVGDSWPAAIRVLRQHLN